MSLIVYKCDTCKRTIEKKQDINALNTIGNCIITDRCRGNLYVEKVVPAQQIPSLTEPVTGLTDWKQRVALYTHEQGVATSTWTIDHNVQGTPTVEVFIDNGTGIIERTTDVIVKLLTDSKVELVFDIPQSGIAQLLNRGVNDSETFKAPNQTTTAASSNVKVQATTGSAVLTLAVPSDKLLTEVSVALINSTTQVKTDISAIPVTLVPTESPWADVSKIHILEKDLQVIEVDLSSYLPTLTANQTYFLYFTELKVNTVVKSADNCLILLTKPPFQAADKNVYQYIDFTTINTVENKTNGLLVNQQIFVDEGSTVSVYPKISY